MSRLSAQRRLRSFAIMFAIEGDGGGGVCVGAQDARVGHISGKWANSARQRVANSIFCCVVYFRSATTFRSAE